MQYAGFIYEDPWRPQIKQLLFSLEHILWSYENVFFTSILTLFHTDVSLPKIPSLLEKGFVRKLAQSLLSIKKKIVR